MADRARSRAWADPGENEIRALLRRSAEVGWRNALRDLPESADFFVERMEYLGLGNWQLLFGPNDSPRILDIGCGFGSLTLGSSLYAGTAVGLDALTQRVEFARLRARQSGRKCAVFMRGNGLALPFSPGTFDIVTLNGVLEWAGLYAEGDPVDLQRKMLEEASRVTSEDGHVCVAIENSVAAETLLGLRDTHTDTHFVTALPEPLSSILLRLRKGEDPRVRLHHQGGYERLFADAGLRTIRLFNLIPSYNNYRFVLQADDSASHRFVYEQLDAGEFYEPAARLRQILATRAPGVLPRLAYSFLIVGRQTNEEPALLDAEASLWDKLGVFDDLSRFAVQMRCPGAVGILLHRDQHPHSFIKCWVHGTKEPSVPKQVEGGLEAVLAEQRRGQFGPFSVASYEFHG